MIILQDAIQVTLCANDSGRLYDWEKRFEVLFGDFTTHYTVGGWKDNDGKVIRESNITVESWGDFTPQLLQDVAKLAAEYQEVENQTSVAVKFIYHGNTTFYLVFSGEWESWFEIVNHTIQGQEV